MIRLHYYPGNASMAPHMLLRELGLPFEMVLVDRGQAAHKSPDYLRLNPNGLIPVLQDDDLVLYETAAILLHLCDTHPEAGLMPGLGTHERAHAYKWMLWLTNTLQAMLIAYFYPERWVDAGNEDGTAQVKLHAQERIGPMLTQIDAQLASHGGPWLLGNAFGAVDPFAFMLCRWTRGFKGPACPPAREFSNLGPYLERVLARPAVQQALAAEKATMPWV